MTNLSTRLDGDPQRLEAIARDIENGDSTEHDPVTVIAALVHAGLGRDLGPSLNQTSPARPGLVRYASETVLAKLFPKATRPSRLALSAGLLQILDAWGSSHEAAQEADDLGEPEFSAYWHGIAHRREPDPGNAAYWFRRVGPHPVFVPLAEAATKRLAPLAEPRITSKLIPGGRWDPIEFVAFCTSAARKKGSIEEQVARRIQRAEMRILIERTAAHL